MLSAVLALAGIIFPISHIANAAHLGGMLTGVIFIRQFVQGRGWQWEFPSRRAAPRELVSTRARKGSSGVRRRTSRTRICPPMNS